MNMECENEKAQRHIERLKEIRYNVMMRSKITKEELKCINNEISSIEEENYKLVISEGVYPFARVKTCIDITRIALLDKLSNII